MLLLNVDRVVYAGAVPDVIVVSEKGSIISTPVDIVLEELIKNIVVVYGGNVPDVMVVVGIST